jgi:two-component system chemotaxis response regulator CheB
MNFEPHVATRQCELALIGASAGAVEALSVVLSPLPPSFGLPLVVVVHLPSSSPSLLPELFGRKTALSVVEAEDKQPLRPGSLYFAPPDYHVVIEPNGLLSLNVDDAVNFSRPSIDVLFESAALSYGSRCLGILLTGASKDGAQGLRAIHRAGGYTVVQDPKTAAVPAMPEAALELFNPDQVLELPVITELLLAFGKKNPS